MAIVHPVGPPENDSERKAIAFLKEHLPHHYHLFHNLELPTLSGFPYQYDLIIVGEYAVYAVEIKGYGGHIRGNAQEWELESGAVYRSPIPLTNRKARILASYLHNQNQLLERVWVQAVILLTDDYVEIDLNDRQAGRVVRLDQAVAYFLDLRRLDVSTDPVNHLTGTICDTISHQSRPLHRQHTIGDYQVLDTIGKNNLYTTWLAEHQLLRTKRRFILKVYSFDIYAESEMRRRQRHRILRAANALHMLPSHRNIVRAHPPFPWEDDKIVLPLEWVDGYSLRGLLDAGTEMNLGRKVNIVRQMCEGLHHSHLHGVVHRDLRPDNVIVPHQGPVKLVNFDCARIEGVDLQTISSWVGRQLDQRYVAPEVWGDCGAASPASDQYAAGVILFEFLTGQPPYEKVREVVAAGGLLSRPSQINPGLSSKVDKVVSRMCAFEPESRYRNLGRVVQTLATVS
jgi:tRNA A-37 threonylcarbamoyl transferase component Bud32